MRFVVMHLHVKNEQCNVMSFRNKLSYFYNWFITICRVTLWTLRVGKYYRIFVYAVRILMPLVDMRESSFPSFGFNQLESCLFVLPYLFLLAPQRLSLPLLTGHGVPPVALAVGQVEHDGRVVCKKLITDLVKHLNGTERKES